MKYLWLIGAGSGFTLSLVFIGVHLILGPLGYLWAAGALSTAAVFLLAIGLQKLEP